MQACPPAPHERPPLLSLPHCFISHVQLAWENKQKPRWDFLLLEMLLPSLVSDCSLSMQIQNPFWKETHGTCDHAPGPREFDMKGPRIRLLTLPFPAVSRKAFCLQGTPKPRCSHLIADVGDTHSHVLWPCCHHGAVSSEERVQVWIQEPAFISSQSCRMLSMSLYLLEPQGFHL